MSRKNIFVTGGAGYVGSSLVPRLLEEHYNVTVLDLLIYGSDVLPSHPNLEVVKGDIRDIKLLQKLLYQKNIVIHLACISNDPSFELNPQLGKEINLDAFDPLVKLSKENGVERFIYASSSSVYGLKSEENVHEEIKLEPLTDYSKFKAQCEKIMNNYLSENFTTVTIRPATVCGYAPRQRLDVVVNILTNLAYHKREISVFGGSQLRPNIHIKDMAEAYIKLLNADKKIIAGEVFNAGYENQSVIELAEIVKEEIGSDVKLKVVPTDDNRSYHISSNKIKEKIGFHAKHTIRDAVIDLKKAFEENMLTDTLNNEMYYNIKRMQSLGLK